jgi:acetyl-CoA carboxylase carboxyl transferase subunit alpha
VISPEGCAAILWRSAEHRALAAAALKMTSTNLVDLGIADEVIGEPPGGAHQDWDAAAASLKEALVRNVKELRALPLDELVARRQAKFEVMGAWREPAEAEPRAGAQVPITAR